MRPRIRTIVVAVTAVVLLTAVSVSAVFAHGGFGRGGGKSNISAAIEEQTGLSQEELRTRVQGGESLADIIEAEGGDLEAVVTAALAGLDEKADALVEAGRLQSDQVDDYKANAEQRVRDWLDGTYEGKRGKGRSRLGGKANSLISIVAEQTDVSVEDIRTKLADGDSLADIIEEADGDVTAVTDAAMEAFETRLATAIENGRVDADKADELRETTRDRIDSALQEDGGPTCNGRGKSGSRGWGRGHGRDAAAAKSGSGKVTLPLGETPSTA